MKTKAHSSNIFLFSIDLEDVRDGVANGHRYKDRVVENTMRYAGWLAENDFRCTFFTVGTIAERYPDLIRELVSRGHEIACHSYSHIPLDKQTPESFKKDLDQNITALLRAGAKEVKGFRAPVFSLTHKTSWAYQYLAQAGISYSSSVLPADNPLYGWKEFGAWPRKTSEGILEFPVTLDKFGPLTVPFAGGVYFRCLPFFMIKGSFKKKFKAGEAVLSYFHPYDLDTEQERFMHGGINNSAFFNFLMYHNRKNVISRLNKILKLNVEVMTFGDYIKSNRNGLQA